MNERVMPIVAFTTEPQVIDPSMLSNIHPLRELTSQTALFLTNNSISNVRPLSGLTSLLPPPPTGRR